MSNFLAALANALLPLLIQSLPQLLEIVTKAAAGGDEHAKKLAMTLTAYNGAAATAVAATNPGPAAANPVAKPAPKAKTLEELNALASAKLVELTGKGATKEDAKAMIQGCAVEYAQVQKISLVPADKVARVFKAVNALDWAAQPPAGAEEEEEDAL